MPNLTDVALEGAFKYKDDVTIRGSIHFIPPLTHRHRRSSTLLLFITCENTPFR